jgi:hypothetical protein
MPTVLQQTAAQPAAAPGSELWVGAAVHARVPAAGAAVSSEPVGWAQLSWQQKREVAGLASTAVASIAFLMLPLLAGDGGPSRPSAPIEIHARQFPIVIAHVGPVPAQVPAAPRTTRPAPRAVRQPVASRPVAAAAVTSDALPILAAASAQSSMVFDSAGAPAPRRPGLLKRLLAGDGKHKVRPFPGAGDPSL